MSFEYQVILFAIDTLNAKLSPIDENLPHSLLPIANRPLISYQLETLEKAGFHSVLIVINDIDSQSTSIRAYVQEIYKGKIEVEFFIIKDLIGTCEILYRIRDKIRTNFIVMNGNLIADEGFIRKMADTHRGSDSSCTILLNALRRNIVPGQPEVVPDATFVDYIALDEKNERVLMMEAATEVESSINISKSLLQNFPNLSVNNDLEDAQFYIFSRWVIDLIVDDQKAKNSQFISIKKNLIPYLLSCQIPNHNKHMPASAINKSQDLALSMSTSATPFNPSYHINQLTFGTIKCMVYLLKTGYCANINNIKSYREINHDITKGASTHVPLEPRGKNNYIDPTAQVSPTSVGADCIIGGNTVIGQRSSVKRSVIGKHCKIGATVKIEGAIIMDYVTIEDGCTINGSVIAHNVYIKSKLSIKDSQIASGLTVVKDLKSKSFGKE